jgi:hypothetical protein
MQGQVRRWPIVAGAAAGAIVWIYDYNFFLNAGGPATPISMAILSATGLERANVLVFMFWPLLVLVLIGAALGFGAARLQATRSAGGSTRGRRP